MLKRSTLRLKYPPKQAISRNTNQKEKKSKDNKTSAQSEDLLKLEITRLTATEKIPGGQSEAAICTLRREGIRPFKTLRHSSCFLCPFSQRNLFNSGFLPFFFRSLLLQPPAKRGQYMSVIKFIPSPKKTRVRFWHIPCIKGS